MTARVLTIAQQKGGAGKTTLAAQLAVAWAKAGRSVALMDIDPQGSLAAWHGIREGNGAAEIHLSQVGGWRVNTEMGRLNQEFDLVIVDSPPHAETEARMAVRAASLVLVPVQPSPMDFWATADTMDMAKAEKVPALFVLNRVPPRGKVVDRVRALMADGAMPVAETTLGNRVAYTASMMDGFGVLESEPRSTAAKEIAALAAELEPKLLG